MVPTERVSSDDPLSRAAAIGAAFDEHAARLLGWFQARTLSREVAADLLAETFAVAIEQLDGFDPSRGEMGQWLWGIAKNLHRQYLRAAQVEERACARLALRIPTVSTDELERADARLDAERLVRSVDPLLSSLTESVAAAVRFRVIEDQPYDVVAHRCGCSIGAARVRVARGLASLAALIEQDGAQEVLR